MPRSNQHADRWPWPASALSADDMHLLWLAKRVSPTRTTITQLVARAVRQAYGASAAGENEQLREAA